MTDSDWKERRNQVARYRAMERETTDPLAARLLHDIVLDLEAELEGGCERSTSDRFDRHWRDASGTQCVPSMERKR